MTQLEYLKEIRNAIDKKLLEFDKEPKIPEVSSLNDIKIIVDERVKNFDNDYYSCRKV